MKQIDIAITTWPVFPERVDYFHRQLESYLAYLTASRHRLRTIVSSETERVPGHAWEGDRLEAVCRQFDVELIWHEGPACQGANQNYLLRHCQGNYILLTVDDYPAKASIDLSRGADFLDGHNNIDLIRYGWPDAPGYVRFAGEVDGWPRVDLACDWPYGDEPQMRRRSFTRHFAPYLEHPANSEANMLARLRWRGAGIVCEPTNSFFHICEKTCHVQRTEKNQYS